MLTVEALFLLCIGVLSGVMRLDFVRFVASRILNPYQTK